MANEQIQQVFSAGGKNFATRAEANDFLRAPKIEAALKVVTGGNAALATFLKTNEDEIQKAFEAGVIARVTKAERKRINAAFDYVANTLKDDPKARYLVENIEAAKESFRWPAVKRLKEEEKVAATMAALTALADEAAATWIVANRAQLENAYNAGIEKRAPPPAGGLMEYQAAKKAGPEALAAYMAAKKARDEKAKADAKAAKAAAEA